MFKADIEAAEAERHRPRVGDDDHPINVEKIKQGLGCLPICEVWIDFPIANMHYVIRHRVPAHERTYTIYDHWGYRKRFATQVFAERNHQMGVDPYILDRYGDAGGIAEHLIENLKYEWNRSWPHHA